MDSPRCNKCSNFSRCNDSGQLEMLVGTVGMVGVTILVPVQSGLTVWGSNSRKSSTRMFSNKVAWKNNLLLYFIHKTVSPTNNEYETITISFSHCLTFAKPFSFHKIVAINDSGRIAISSCQRHPQLIYDQQATKE